MRWRGRNDQDWVAVELEGSLSVWLNEGNDRAQAALRSNSAWGIEMAEAYFWDQETGLLTFTFADHAVHTPFQFLGSYHSGSHTWMWAWAIDSIDPGLRGDSVALREAGENMGSPLLTSRIVEVTREDADCLALLALRNSRHDGFYKSPDGDQISYLSFGTPIPS